MRDSVVKGRRGKAKHVTDWMRMRRNHLILYPECRICEDIERPHVHHIRYRGSRGRSEMPGDLVTLCEFHHNEFHRLYGTAGRHKGSLIQNTIDYIAEKRTECNAELNALQHL